MIKRRKSKSVILVSLILLVSTMLSQMPAGSSAGDNAKDDGDDYNHYSYSTGYKEPTEEERKWMEENMIKTEDVKLNKFGLERINKERKAKKLDILSEKIAVEAGEEVDSKPNKLTIGKNNKISTDSMSVSLASVLPDSVDNSELAAFPPIRDQGNLNSCTGFSTTYYQMTYMVARSEGWNTKNNSDNTTKFSPKWTYNFINSGKDDGSNYGNAYRLLKENGAALWSEFPYDGSSGNPKNYLEWPTQSSIYKNAMKYRVDKMGTIYLNNNYGTKFTSPDDSDLTDVKTMLANGYVLVVSTNIDSWRYTNIKDDPATTQDSQFVGQQACYMVDGRVNPHSMTVVGYNDDIWVDINNNNIVESGEKGAFKIANSWGPNWRNNGYMWLCYDALNYVSSVSGAPTAWNYRDVSFSELYWITVRQSYNPEYIAEFTISHSSRNQISTYAGFSSSTDTNPVLIWKPMAFGEGFLSGEGLGGNYAFDGTTTPCDATVALDLTDLTSDKVLNPDGNWYLIVSDTSSDGKPAILKSFKFIDNVRGTSVNSTAAYPQIIDGQAVMNKIYSTRTANPSANWTIYNSFPYTRHNLALAAVNDNIFVFGNNDRQNSVMAYNLQTGLWSSKNNAYPSYFFTGAVAFGDKIYVIGTSDYSQSILFEYSPNSDTWVTKAAFPFKAFTSLVVANNRIYIIGGLTEYDMVSEYDPQTGTMSAKTNIPASLSDAAIASVNNKIYVIGGSNNGSLTNSVYAFDTVSGTWSTKASMPCVKNYFLAEAINGKIYTFGCRLGDDYISSIEEYDPASDTWTPEKNSMILNLESYYLTKLDNQIYMLDARTKVLLGFSFNNASTPTPTPTPTSTPTPTITPTSSITATPTGKVTPTPTPTSKVTSTPTPTPTASNNATPTPTQTASSSLQIEFFNPDKSATINQIGMNFRIKNTGTTPVNLANVKVRYYYTIDGEKPQSFWCDYSNIGSSKITSQYVKLSVPVTGSDGYMEIGFTSDAGNLAAGSSVDIYSRIAKNDWSSYTQTNDYSFNSQATSFVSWNKTPAYISGSKVWGNEP